MKQKAQTAKLVVVCRSRNRNIGLTKSVYSNNKRSRNFGIYQEIIFFHSRVLFPQDQQNLASTRCDSAPHVLQLLSSLLCSMVVFFGVVVASFILPVVVVAYNSGEVGAAIFFALVAFFTPLDTAEVDDDDDDDDMNARSFIKSRYASAKLAAWAGMIATPAKIDAPTTNRPDTVTGYISPNPTVVNVVNPKYNAVK